MNKLIVNPKTLVDGQHRIETLLSQPRIPLSYRDKLSLARYLGRTDKQKGKRPQDYAIFKRRKKLRRAYLDAYTESQQDGSSPSRKDGET